VSVERDRALWRELVAGDVRALVSVLEPEEPIMLADDACLDRVALGFARVIDAKSPWTYRHSEGVAELAVGVGRVLGFPEGELRVTGWAALLHDIGKLGVSNRVLDKPGPLTPAERRAIGRHPEYALRILARVAGLAEVAELAAAHHERPDGFGYPLGLTAEDLPVAARVLRVADIYEALTADRPYRPALPREEACAIMRDDLGAGICPDAFDALRGYLEREGPPAAPPP
jgi:putative nucleotidyltransferase with HDIG domain